MFAHNVIKIKPMKKAKKGKAPERERYFGLTKVRVGAKFAWLSLQNKHGWSLGFALNNRTEWIRNIRFATRQEVERALGKSKVVFIPLKHAPKSK